MTERHGPYTLSAVHISRLWRYHIVGPDIEVDSPAIYEQESEALYAGRQYGRRTLEDWA